MKPLLIGEAPSKNEPLPKPLEGRIGRRLASFAGITFEQYLERFDRINLLEVRQDTKEKGFTFNRETARVSAVALIPRIDRYENVILLGKRVRDAFGIIKEYFEPHHWKHYESGLYEGTTIYVVPHPSGVNRWFNDPANREKMSAFMRSIL